MSLSATHKAAQEYREMGLHPIRCRPRAKKPMVPWAQHQTTSPTPEQIDQWWSETPDANVGLVLGRGTFAVDLDGGYAAEQLLLERGIPLPYRAPRSQTANGFHVLLSSEKPIPDRVAMLTGPDGKKPQVDIRGVGVIVAPPSIHPSGTTYTWTYPLEQLPAPAAPAKLIELITGGPSVELPMREHGAHWIAEALHGVPEGQRDFTCTRLAGYLLGQGIAPDIAEGILIQSFARACDPPYPAADVRKCVQSVARREGQTRVALADSILDIRQAVSAFKARQSEDTSRRLRLGIPRLDKVMRGIEPGELLVILARTGSLKTMLEGYRWCGTGAGRRCSLRHSRCPPRRSFAGSSGRKRARRTRRWTRRSSPAPTI